MANLAEVWAKLHQVWSADTALTDLLATPQSVYRGWPPTHVAAPFITFECYSLGVVSANSAVGQYLPSVQINVYAEDQDVAAAVYAVLEANWSIPRANADAIETDNFRVTSAYFGPLQHITRLQRTADDLYLHHHTCDLSLRVVTLPD